MKAEQFRKITDCFLLNELGDPHFLIHKFKWHTVEYNISRFQVIYQTRERVFHQDIQTPRSGLKKRGAAEFF